ncbi:hypothetical protein C2E25_15770 [Geothermobacter hydrogeniphilus]|uniref:Major paralogous domain-containing protein n=1 Tax=Geothermobacter hydrogeniphilus TaxID=1969733 RepID=A0A2K2H6C1_9BACT|nr:hypothetical protein [Geothermobacter hydrogeniphilus]PNU18789.1 hypothetical protein C2E25_15770 [Geothermobacter hydrogeniphilus]
MIPGAACTGQGQVLQGDGAQWVCVNLKQLTPSGGQAHGFELTDSWGETWDGIPRQAANWTDADASCQALGGRLPTMTEIYRNNGASGSGDVTGILDTSYLWTLVANDTAGSRMIGRLSDGTMSAAAETAATAYRCI